jgi:hypothetical protein
VGRTAGGGHRVDRVDRRLVALAARPALPRPGGVLEEEPHVEVGRGERQRRQEVLGPLVQPGEQVGRGEALALDDGARLVVGALTA